LSIDDTSVSFSLEINLEEAYTQLRKLQTITYRSLGLIRRLTGDENLDRAIAKMQKAIMVMNQLRLAYASLQALRMAAGDPLAWAMAGLAAAEAAVSFWDVSNS
jgi:hypothetical protein